MVGNGTKLTDSASGAIDWAYDVLDRAIQEVTPQGIVRYTYTRNTGGVGAPTITALTPNTGNAGATVNASLTGTNLTDASLVA